MTNFIVENNLPIAIADKCGQVQKHVAILANCKTVSMCQD